MDRIPLRVSRSGWERRFRYGCMVSEIRKTGERRGRGLCTPNRGATRKSGSILLYLYAPPDSAQIREARFFPWQVNGSYQ